MALYRFLFAPVLLAIAVLIGSRERAGAPAPAARAAAEARAPASRSAAALSAPPARPVPSHPAAVR